MSRPVRWTLIFGSSILALVTLAFAIAVFVAQSSWLREQVRQRIVAEAEKATGGRVEIDSFQLDWRTLTAQVNNFVIHGSEPAGSSPLLRVRSITIKLKVISFLKKTVDVESVDAAEPQVHLIVHPDGTTNVPQPDVPISSKHPVAVILDLAIGRFRMRDGEFQVNSRRMPWNAAGENFRAQFVYDHAAPSYHGDLSIQPLHFIASKDLPVDMAVNVSLALERNKLIISAAHLETARSRAELSGAIDGFSSPEYRLQYIARVSLDELLRTLRFRAHPEGILQVTGNASFRDFAHYFLAGRLSGDALAFGHGKIQVHAVRAESDFRVDPEKIDFSRVHLAILDGSFNGHARIEQLDRIRVEGEANQFDLQRIAQSFSLGPLPWDGVLSGPVDITGLISELNQGRFTAHGQLVISPASGHAPVRGAVDATYDGYRDSVDLGRSLLQLPSTRLDFAGTLGRQLRIRLQSTDLDDLLPALKIVSSSSTPALPVHLTNGSARFDGTVTGPLASPQIAGHAMLQSFIYSREKFDSFAADVAARDSSLRLENGVLSRGSLRAQFAGTVSLHRWQPDTTSQISANASFHGADLQDWLSLAGRPGLPISGSLSGSVQMTGSLDAPHLAAGAVISRGSLYGEPFDRLTTRVSYENNTATLSNGELAAGGKQLTFGATYAHAPRDFENGTLSFQVASNHMPLDQIQMARQHQFQLGGSIQLTAQGSAQIAISPNSSPFRLTALTADVEGQGILVEGRPVGAVHLTATTSGPELTAQMQSAVANSVIHADGRWQLADDYPGSVQLSFTRLDLASLESWLRLPASSFQAAGSLEGKATVSGPALRPDAWTGTLEIPRLEISPLPADVPGGDTEKFALRNQGPVRLGFANSIVRVETARLTGQATDVTLTGDVSLRDKNPLDLRLNGSVDLATLRDFNSDLIASGKVNANADIRGPLTQPVVVGRVELQNASLYLTTLPMGLTNANGAILFTGDRATLQKITAQTGGGQVTLTGFVVRSGDVADMRIELLADHVRLRYPEGVSTLADAHLTWTGTSLRSLVSGTVTILRTGFTPRTDFASILASSDQPARVPATQTGFLGGMNFDIQVETASGVTVQSEIAQQIQAEASLRLRGTLASPALLGRINITQGQLTFFGSQYTIGQGTISFLNPVKIEPIVNLDLQTKARGVDVTITISGPVNKLSVTYRSDPPLQFADIVALLATGRAPTSDPALAARETGAAQSWQQMGASALVGQALESPDSGRLERFFGVSRIKIDPTLTGITDPQARLSIEQPVTPDITFTYITYLNQSNPQVVQVEWALNKQLSLVAIRDQNGMFGMDFFYKKRFK